MQKMLVDLKNTMGNYLYNTISPLDQQIENELSMLKYSYPPPNRQNLRKYIYNTKKLIDVMVCYKVYNF